MRIFLIGFMGSGKTHWGTRIAERLHIPLSTLNQKIKRLNIEIRRDRK